MQKYRDTFKPIISALIIAGADTRLSDWCLKTEQIAEMQAYVTRYAAELRSSSSSHASGSSKETE